MCDQTGREEPIEAMVRMYVDDPERMGAQHYESPMTLPARSNVFMTPTWKFDLGEHRTDFFVVLVEDGTELTMPCFFESKPPGIGPDARAVSSVSSSTRISSGAKVMQRRVRNTRMMGGLLRARTILNKIDHLMRELGDWMKAFGDTIDQIEQRLNQALRLYNRKDVYDHPFEWERRKDQHTRDINMALRYSNEAKKQ